MSKRKSRGGGKQDFTVNRRAGRRAFSYHIPPEVAGQLPPGATITMVSLTAAEIYPLALQVEPEVTRRLGEKPAKKASKALLQPPELPIPHKRQLELAHTLALSYGFAVTWPYTAHFQRSYYQGQDNNIAGSFLPILPWSLARDSVMIRQPAQTYLKYCLATSMTGVIL